MLRKRWGVFYYENSQCHGQCRIFADRLLRESSCGDHRHAAEIADGPFFESERLEPVWGGANGWPGDPVAERNLHLHFGNFGNPREVA